jgi:hypothetical protein
MEARKEAKISGMYPYIEKKLWKNMFNSGLARENE